MTVTELISLTERQTGEMKEVLGELSQELHVTSEMLVKAVEAKESHVFALLDDDEKIIGTATLCVSKLPTGKRADVEAVVVKKEYRGQGLGKLLMEHVIDYTRQDFSGIAIHLTSNPNRVAANEMYKHLGFEKIETNVYKLEVKGGSRK